MSLHVFETREPHPDAGRLVAGDPRATFFLEPSWMEALVRGYRRLSPRYLVLEEDGEAVGMIPLTEIRPGGFREVVSMPFGSHGGPVLAPGVSPEGVHLLAREFAARLRRPGTVRFEMTLFDPPPSLVHPLESTLGRYRVDSYTMVLDLTPGWESLWNGYQQQLRRSVRVARKAGVEIREESGMSGLDVFYRLYSTQSREWDLSWHHARPALEAMVERLGDRSRVWIASHEGKDVCAQFTLYRPDREVHLWISGAGSESRPVAAFHHLLSTIAADAARKGYSWLNFGSSMGNPGVEKFKASFGSKPRPMLRFHHQARWVGWIQKLRWR